jgi:hypothetical protein
MYVAVRNTGTIVSVAAGPKIKKTDPEMSAFYLVVADEQMFALKQSNCGIKESSRMTSTRAARRTV